MPLIHSPAIFFNFLSIISLAYSGLVFIPPQVVINPRLGKTEIRVVLNKKPNGTVDVYYNLENMDFDRCSLTFNETTWDKPQKLAITPLPYFTKSDTKRKLSARFKTVSCGDESYNNVDTFLPITRSPGQGGTCEALADPHYRVFYLGTNNYTGV